VRHHPRHNALAALIPGLILSGAPGWAVGVAAATLPLVGLVTGRPVVAVIACGLLLAGAGLGAARRYAIDSAPVEPYVGHAVTIRGPVVRRERPTPSAYRFRMRVNQLSIGTERWQRTKDLVQVRIPRGPERRGGQTAKPPSRAIGDVVEVQGALSPLPEEPPDYVAYLRRAGVHAVLRTNSVVTLGRRDGPLSLLDGIRRRAEVGVSAGLDGRMSALAAGIVLGQDERISRETVEEFQVSGLAHLLAVSGQNVTLLAVLALPLFGAVGLGRRTRLAGVLGLICIYVPLTGAGPSIMRAGAMGAAATVARLSGRPASRWYALMLACAFTLAIDPRAWLDAGWQLSFAAVVGIFCLGPHLRRAFDRLPAPLAEGTGLTVAATLATAPLLAFHFERLSVVSLLANLLALPVVAPIMWVGTLAATAAQFSTGAAGLLNAVNGFLLAYLAAIAHWSARLPGAVVSLKVGSPLDLALAYIVPAAVIGGYFLVRGHPVAKLVRRHRLRAAAVATVVCIAVAGTRGGHAAGPPDRFTATFLDIGQGDATLLRTPAGLTALIDGGPHDSNIVSKLRSAGVEAIDVMVLTHSQEDHAGGLAAVLKAMPVRVLLDGGGSEPLGGDSEPLDGGTSDPLHTSIVALARSRGTRIVPARAGTTLHLGRLRIAVLSPEGPGIKGADPNQTSVVALASYGSLDLLLTADAESDVTLPLTLPDVELLKVAHHGSGDTGLKALLERVHPEVAVIEVGAGNRYGHPDPDTLATLERFVPTVRRTDRDGEVTVPQDATGLTVASERSPAAARRP
jgi:competence protein ComEC